MISEINIDLVDLKNSKLKNYIKAHNEIVISAIKLKLVYKDGSRITVRVRCERGNRGMLSICKHDDVYDKTYQLEFMSEKITNTLADYFKTLLIVNKPVINETINLVNFIINNTK